MKLLDKINITVFPTNASKKFVLNGVTKIYPIYKIKIDELYYNDQNDRIATWISQYKNEYGNDYLNLLNIENYNDVIEKFVISSNPQSIEKTQNNIEILGQREPGVVLNDGRIIDGNRRFTCIRRLYKKNPCNCWFEAIILDLDINNDKKRIKMLELTIQHGEEKKVDYNHLERLVGVYQDVVDTKLLTVEEYSQSTNESIAETRKRVEAATILAEYLEYIGMPKQFHIAREYQIVSLISDMLEVFKKCSSQEMINRVKEVVFINLLMGTIGDERKYTKNLNQIIVNGNFDEYYKEQKKIETRINNRRSTQQFDSLIDLKMFSKTNVDIVQDLSDSFDEILLDSKRTETHSKPSQIFTKSIKSLNEIDLNIVNNLTPVEKEVVVNQIKKLNRMVNKINEVAGGSVQEPITEVKQKVEDHIKNSNTLTIKPIKCGESFNYISPLKITSLCFKTIIDCSNLSKAKTALFTNEDYEPISDSFEICNGENELLVELNSKISLNNKCYLVIRDKDYSNNEANIIYEIAIDISFVGDFGF